MAIVYNTKNWSLLFSYPKSQPLLLQAFEMERAFSNLSDSGCTNCSDDYSQVQWTLTFASVINNLIYDRHCWRHCGNARKWPRLAGHPKERQISFSSRLFDLQPFNSWLASIRNIYAFSRKKYNLLSSSEKQCHIHHDNEICRQVSLACFHRQCGWNYNRSSHGNPTWPYYHYHKLMTKTFAFSYISVTWLTSAIIAAVYSFAETNQKCFSWIYCKTLLLATIFMYSYILRVAHAQRIRIVAMLHRDNEDRFSKQTPVCLEDKATKTLKESKAAKTFAIVVGAFVVTWIPLIFYPSIAPWSESWYYEGFEWAKTFSLWNSFLNRYIYFARNRRYRQTALQMLKTIQCWPRLPAHQSQVGVEIYGETTPNNWLAATLDLGYKLFHLVWRLLFHWWLWPPISMRNSNFSGKCSEN